MRAENKQTRHLAITEAAYAILADKGYDGASMLSIAKAARASNETLYRWYGDKRGLFEAMVRDNAAEVSAQLSEALTEGDPPLETLRRVAPVFLTMLLGDKAIALNRAAAADATGALGHAIAAGGREAVQPLFQHVLLGLTQGDADQAQVLTGQFLGLLVGDLQIRRVIGTAEAPNARDIDLRVAATFDAFEKLL